MQKQLAIKFLIVMGLGILLLIPIDMVRSKVYERKHYQQEASEAVAESWTSSQTFVTPVLVIPYQLRSIRTSRFHSNGQKSNNIVSNETHHSVILAEKISTAVEITNKNLKKGIYKIPVYTSDIHWQGTFSSEDIHKAKQKIMNHDRFESMANPYVSFAISDLRGIGKTPELLINGTQTTLVPGSRIPQLNSGLHSEINSTELERSLELKLNLTLSGMESYSIVPLAKHSDALVQSNWPHPKFYGAALPKEREITQTGFKASWYSSLYANNASVIMDICFTNHSCEEVLNAAAGVRFIDPVNVYLQTDRALKYAILFIGLSFISFFMFELVIGVQIHPVQYTLVGLAIASFYLLLVSLSEHIPLGIAYLMGTLFCTGLLLTYVRHVFRSRAYALIYCLVLLALYGLLYVIIQAEDYALLMGSILVFAVLSMLMIMTRKLDWYQLAQFGAEDNSDLEENRLT